MAPTEADTGTKRCPFCAEQILADAQKCRFCGEFLSGKKSSVDSSLLRRICSISGSLLLLIAPFAPFVSAPIFGRITLFQQGKGDGVILLVLAMIALGFSTFARYGFLWISGLFGLFEIGNLFYFFYNTMPTALRNYKQEAGTGIFGSIGEAALRNVDPDWGAAVILIGTILSLGVAVSTDIRRRSLTFMGKIGIALALVVIVWKILLVFFPYLSYWPTLLER